MPQITCIQTLPLGSGTHISLDETSLAAACVHGLVEGINNAIAKHFQDCLNESYPGYRRVKTAQRINLDENLTLT